VLDENFNIIPEPEWDPAAELDKLDPPLTEWFPADVNPVREGAYQINDDKIPALAISYLCNMGWQKVE
jgi:hypothetical protein